MGKYLAEFLMGLKNFSFLTNEFEYIISRKKYHGAPSSIVSYNSNCGRIFFFIKKLVTKSIVHKKQKKILTNIRLNRNNLNILLETYLFAHYCYLCHTKKKYKKISYE